MQSIYAHVSIHLFIVNFNICNCALLRLYKRPKCPNRYIGNQGAHDVVCRGRTLFFGSCWSVGTLLLHFIYPHDKLLAPPEPQKYTYQIQPGPPSASGVFVSCVLVTSVHSYFSCRVCRGSTQCTFSFKW